MKAELEKRIWDFQNAYARGEGQPLLWEKPIVKAADAHNPLFLHLKQLVTPEHALPTDYLPEARTVISYFLPFQKEVTQSNREGSACSEAWAKAYVRTNALAQALNEALVAHLEAAGYAACAPQNAGMISRELPLSLWSQRHVAYIAGQGTFGMNNMLISERGCAGRYYSLITSMPMPADPIVQEERCLYKQNGKCGLCMKRCMAKALCETGFDRYKCLEQCLKNKSRYPGADVCGKCTVGLPCSHAGV